MTRVNFSQLFFSHTDSLRAFALFLTKDQEHADDLFQDTAYKAFRYQHQYTPHTNLQAWLMTIMRNTFINDWRRRQRRQAHQDSQLQDHVITTGLVDRNGGEEKILMEELEQAIHQLDPMLRDPFLMAHQGYKYEEVAQHLQVPLGTIKSRIHLARKQLQKAVSHLYRNRSLSELLD